MPKTEKVALEELVTREAVDDVTDRVTYLNPDTGKVACISIEPNLAEQKRLVAEQAENNKAAEATAAAVGILEQQAGKDTKNPPAALVAASLVDVVLDLQARVAKMEGSP